MEQEQKKSKTGLIIIIIIILLLILFAVWYFLLRDNKEPNNGGKENQQEIKDDEPKEIELYEYDYRNGILTTIVDENRNPKQTEFVIDGIILIGNRHSYLDTDDTDTILNNFVKEGYKKTGINSSFYLNEHIEMYLDTKYSGNDEDVKVLITPHNKVEEYEKMTSTELINLASEKGAVLDYQKPDVNNNKYIGDPYVNADYPEGKYDILFTYKGKIAYFVTIDLTKEPAE